MGKVRRSNRARKAVTKKRPAAVITARQGEKILTQLKKLNAQVGRLAGGP